jgi:gliding motility-associated-like protein
LKDKDEIKELFSEKLGGYEAGVNPRLWENIASQVAVSTGGAVTGLSVFSKIIIAVRLISAIVVTTAIIKNNSQSDQNKKTIVEKSTNNDGRTKDKRPKQEVVVDNKKQVPAVEIEEQLEVELESTPQGNNDAVKPELAPPISNNIIEQASNSGTEKIAQLETKTTKITQAENNNTTGLDGNTEDLKENSITSETVVENQTASPENATYKIGALPNIFSPNNDGENDFFLIESMGLEEFNIVVLNNKSKVVYQSTNPDFIWDGNDLSGSPAPSGYTVRYVYYITARDKNGAPVNKGSSLRIMR